MRIHCTLATLLCAVSLSASSVAGERTLLSLGTWRVCHSTRTTQDGAPEEQIVIRGADSKAAWAGPWGETAMIFAHARSNVPSHLLWPDLTGDGVPKLYVRMLSGSEGYLGTLTVLKLGASVEAVASFPECPGEGPRVEVSPAGKGVVLCTEQFIPLLSGRAVEQPLQIVYLRWTNHTYTVASDLMSAMAGQVRGIQSQSRTLQGQFGTDGARLNAQGEPEDLWVAASALAWSGNASGASNLIEAAWPPGRPGMADRQSQFFEELRKNPLYPHQISFPNGGKSRK